MPFTRGGVGNSPVNYPASADITFSAGPLATRGQSWAEIKVFTRWSLERRRAGRSDGGGGGEPVCADGSSESAQSAAGAVNWPRPRAEADSVIKQTALGFHRSHGHAG